MDFEKSMKWANKKRTICEVIREIDDDLEEDEIVAWRIANPTIEARYKDIRKLLEEVHGMAKKMTKKLYKYSKEWDKEFWEDNKDYEEDLKRRLNKGG
jgi:hypothetical protein